MTPTLLWHIAHGEVFTAYQTILFYLLSGTLSSSCEFVTVAFVVCTWTCTCETGLHEGTAYVEGQNVAIGYADISEQIVRIVENCLLVIVVNKSFGINSWYEIAYLAIIGGDDISFLGIFVGRVGQLGHRVDVLGCNGKA